MISVLDTGHHFDLIPIPPDLDDFDNMVITYKKLGIGMNEINRSMGLLDLVPEVLVEPVRRKMRFIHELIVKTRKQAITNIPQ